MPNFEEHKRISVERTDDEFAELHKWMDEATTSLKFNHRLERHFYMSDYEEFIANKWGKKAVVEWLFHIAIDNIETANKFAKEIYNKAYDKISIEFEDKEISAIEFTKNFENSEKITRYEKENSIRKNEKNYNDKRNIFITKSSKKEGLFRNG